VIFAKCLLKKQPALVLGMSVCKRLLELNWDLLTDKPGYNGCNSADQKSSPSILFHGAGNLNVLVHPDSKKQLRLTGSAKHSHGKRSIPEGAKHACLSSKN
jgi:hypothetical protein